MFHVNFNPTKQQLRQFGIICLMALPLVAWLWTRDAAMIGWAVAAGLTLCGIGFVAPAFLRPVFLGLTIITLPIGLVAGEVAMLLIYFGLFLPMSVVFRIIGRDSLRRRSQADEKSFWRERRPPASAGRYYHQF